MVVAVDRDDTAVLITLTARQLNAHAYLVAAVREEENASLLEHGGANLVITSSAAAGRLLGLGTLAPRAVRVLEDLMSTGQGLDVAERAISPEEVGPLAQIKLRMPVLAVVRDDRVLMFDDDEAQELRPGDRLLYVEQQPAAAAESADADDSDVELARLVGEVLDPDAPAASLPERRRVRDHDLSRRLRPVRVPP